MKRSSVSHVEQLSSTVSDPPVAGSYPAWPTGSRRELFHRAEDFLIRSNTARWGRSGDEKRSVGTAEDSCSTEPM